MCTCLNKQCSRLAACTFGPIHGDWLLQVLMLLQPAEAGCSCLGCVHHQTAVLWDMALIPQACGLDLKAYHQQ
jgi:hypothetical protein